MELSESEKASIDAVYRARHTMSGAQMIEGIFLAGKAAGIAEGLEMAAKACEDIPLPIPDGLIVGDHRRGFNVACADCATAIRALRSSP